MNKQLISFSVFALLILLISSFSATFVVKADRTDGQWVAVTQTFDKMLVFPHPGETSKLDSGVVQMRGWQYDYTAHLTADTTTYQLYAVTTYGGSYNPTTDVVNLQYDVVWYAYTGFTPQVSPNGFAGNFELKMTGITAWPKPINYPGVGEAIHCVLQGFGSLKGQTLVLSYDGPYHGGDLTGFLLIK